MNNLANNICYKNQPYICYYNIFNAINLFKQPNFTLQVKVSIFKFLNYQIFVRQPELTTIQTATSVVFILSQYFCLLQPFLFL